MAALLVLPVLAAVQVVAAAPAQAELVAGFEVDGNTPDGAEAGVDWGTPVGTTASDPVGNVDTTTFKGSKEFEHPTTWERGTGLAPNQDDISDVFFHDDVVDGDIWGYVGFRRYTTSGTTNFDVEFNKLPNAAAATYLPVRSVGDVMVRFEQDGNSAFELTAAWFWTRVSSGDWGTGCIEVPGYTPRSGWCAVDIDSVDFTGATGESGHFAEGAFNFSSLLDQGNPGATCAGGDFGTMNIRSFTGNANESALKDYVDAITIDVDDTCGELEIYKVDQFGDAVPGATFTIDPNPIPGATGVLTVTDGGANDPDATADGAIVIDPATPGTYTVIETAAPPGYELVEPVSARTWTVTVGENGQGSLNTPLSVQNRLYFAPPTILNQPDHDIDHNWEVSKSVDDPTTVNVPQGTPATFTYTVLLEALPATRTDYGGTITLDNPNDHAMRGTLGVAINGGDACTIDTVTDLDDNPANGFQVNLPAGERVLTYSCTVAPDAEPPAGTTATIAWNQDTYPQPPADPAPTYTRSDSSPFTIDQRVDETTTVNDVFDGVAGTTKTWGPFDWDDVRNPDATPPHTIVVDTYTRDVTGVPGECTSYDNVVTETADGTTDTERVKVCVGKDLDITKDAELGFQRDLLWSIEKGGPGTVFTGEDANGVLQRMVRYTIDVTARGMSDTQFGLSGTIRIDNPNAWPVTGTITDTVVIDGDTITCDVDGADADADGAEGHQVTVPANAVDHEVTYSCAGVDEGDYVGKNTVTFDYSADSHEYPDADDTATRTVDVEVAGDPEPAHQKVTITDLLDGTDVTGALPQSEFDWTIVNGMDGNTQRVPYDVLLGTTADTCTDHTNVVSIDGLTYPGTSDGHTVTVCSPGVGKTVEADHGQKQLWDLTKKVDQTKVEISAGGSATFEYTVKATPGDVVDDGTSSWSGVLSVHNPSTTTALTVDVTDLPSVTGWTCQLLDDASAVEVLPGATLLVDYECTGTGHPSGSNTVEVGFDRDQVVRKTVDVAFEPRAEVRDSVVEVWDDKTDPGNPVLLGEADASDPDSWTFTYALVKTGVAGACTTYTNNAVVLLEASDDPTAQAKAELCVEKPLTVDVSAQGRYGVTYPWTIDKEVDQTRVEVDEATGEATFDYTVTVRAGEAQPAGWTMGGSIEVSNPNGYAGGAITLTDADVTTDVGGGAACTTTLPDPPVVPVASGGEAGTLLVPFTCTFTGEPATSGTVSATVTWDPAGSGEVATASDSGAAGLSVGQETHRTVDVIDDKTDPANPVLLEEGLTWASGLVKSYEYSLTLPGTPGTCVDHTNTAVVDLTPGQGSATTSVDEKGNPTDQQKVTVCVKSPLAAEVSAQVSLARAYAWSISKSVDATQRTVDASGNATFRYTVVARAGDATDSGWTMSGQVRLTNPNTYEGGDVTADVSASTNLGGGAVCSVAGGGVVVVPAEVDGSGSVTLAITCTFASRPAGSGQLTVTATSSTGEAAPAVTRESASVTFAVGSETNKVVDIVDDKTRPGERVVLEEDVVWAPGLVRTYTYDLALAGGAAGACQAYTNTAMVDVAVGVDPTASTTASVCVPVVVTPPPVTPPAPPEVLPAEAFGKAVGTVRATCQGTVRASLKNRSGVKVTYRLRVGKKVHRIEVGSLQNKKFRTSGKARAKVTLKLGTRVLDRIRVPARCALPEVLPATGLRAAQVEARVDHQASLMRGH